jgi:hypothetical protein
MKWIHPNLGKAAALAATVWIVCATGCRSRSGAMPSPFLAPDRVPPPATRALPPGQAQPYYPGDPLPVMQSAATPPAAAVANASPAASPQATGDSGLAWTPPGGPTPVARPNSVPAAGLITQSNEPSVAVPKDDDALRFALPAAAPTLISQAAVATPHEPQQLAQLAAAPGPSAVTPASYNAPLPESTPIAGSQAGGISSTQVTPVSPWRSPQITQESTAPSSGPSTVVSSAIPQGLPHQNTIDVRLRAVPSPPPATSESTTPRIRLPGYSPSQPIGVSGPAPAAVYFHVPPPGYGTGPQSVQISALPPSYNSATNLAAIPAPAASPDGFRPRGSMR